MWFVNVLTKVCSVPSPAQVCSLSSANVPFVDGCMTERKRQSSGGKEMKSNFLITYSDMRTNMSLIFQKTDCVVVLCKRSASEQTIVNTPDKLDTNKSLCLDSPPPGLAQGLCRDPRDPVGRPLRLHVPASWPLVPEAHQVPEISPSTRRTPE